MMVHVHIKCLLVVFVIFSSGSGQSKHQPFGPLELETFCTRGPFDKYLQNSGLTTTCQKAPRGHMKPFGFHQESWPEIPTLDEWPDPQTFYRDYMRTSTPLLVRKAAKKWPAYTRWSNMSYLREQFGEDRFDVLFRFVYDKYHSLYSTLAMKDFLDIYETQNVYMDSTASSKMLKDLHWPKFLFCDTLFPMVKQIAIFMNKGGSSSRLHLDATDTFMTQVTGSRRWLLVKWHPLLNDRDAYSEEFNWHSGMSPINPEFVDLLKYKDIANMVVYNVTVNPGDTIYIPETWYHQVRAFDKPNIGIAIFLNYLWCELLTSFGGTRSATEACAAVRMKKPKNIQCNNTIVDNMTMSELVDKFSYWNRDAFREAEFRDVDPGNEMVAPHPMKGGKDIPAFGVGVPDCGHNSSDVINLALKRGFRLFLTEVNLGQEELGKALPDNQYASRDKTYLVLKIHPRYSGYQATKKYIQKALANLKTTYLDHVILQAPLCDNDWFVCDNNHVEGTWQESWRAMKELRDGHFIKSLGVGHFSLQQIQEILISSKNDLSLVYNRFDPVVQNTELRNFCKKNGLVFMGHSITGERIVKDGLAKKNPVQNSKVMSFLGFKYQTSPAAIVLHYAMTYKHVVATFDTCSHIDITFNWQATRVDTSDDPGSIKNVEMLEKQLQKADLVVTERDLMHERASVKKLTDERAMI